MVLKLLSIVIPVVICNYLKIKSIIHIPTCSHTYTYAILMITKNYESPTCLWVNDFISLSHLDTHKIRFLRMPPFPPYTPSALNGESIGAMRNEILSWEHLPHQPKFCFVIVQLILCSHYANNSLSASKTYRYYYGM